MRRFNLRYFAEGFRRAWLFMLTPPWRDVEGGDNRGHTFLWLVGWAWAVAGILLGVVIAPYFLDVWGLADSSFQVSIVIGIAALAGFLLQFLGWCLMALLTFTDALIRGDTKKLSTLAGVVLMLVVIPLPLVAVGYTIYLYAITIGAQKALVTIGVISGVLVKLAITVGVLILGSLIIGPLPAGFIRWLRRGRAK
jgi:hypothetical protein